MDGFGRPKGAEKLTLLNLANKKHCQGGYTPLAGLGRTPFGHREPPLACRFFDFVPDLHHLCGHFSAGVLIRVTRAYLARVFCS